MGIGEIAVSRPPLLLRNGGLLGTGIAVSRPPLLLSTGGFVGNTSLSDNCISCPVVMATTGGVMPISEHECSNGWSATQLNILVTASSLGMTMIVRTISIWLVNFKIYIVIGPSQVLYLWTESWICCPTN